MSSDINYVYTSVSPVGSYYNRYSQCYRNRKCVPASSFTSPVIMKLKWLLRRLQGSVPKVVVFGSGLESLPFVRRLMWEESSPYKTIGLVPGKDGMVSMYVCKVKAS